MRILIQMRTNVTHTRDIPLGTLNLRAHTEGIPAPLFWKIQASSASNSIHPKQDFPQLETTNKVHLTKLIQDALAWQSRWVAIDCELAGRARDAAGDLH